MIKDWRWKMEKIEIIKNFGENTQNDWYKLSSLEQALYADVLVNVASTILALIAVVILLSGDHSSGAPLLL